MAYSMLNRGGIEELVLSNVHAYIMGEHGDSSFVPWDHAYVGCKRIKDIINMTNL